jgi:hypothetical protein
MPPFRLSPYPRGPRSGPGYAVPIHQHLIDPIRATGKHVPTSRLCGYTKRLGCAGAPRPPASGSVLSLQILVDMSPSLTPEKSAAVLIQFLRHRRGLRQIPNGSAFSSIPQSVSRGEVISELHNSSLALQPADLFALLTDQTRLSPRLRGLLLPGFHQNSRPLLVLDMATVATG